jgi:tetratricopeptide (TPR) repeat protein
MTQIRDPRLRTLLTQAERNANYGKNAAAEMMYRQIIDEAPEAEEAWLGLARVTGDPAEKRAAYERALALAPENPAAVAGLAVLDGRPVPPEAAAALAALEPPAEEPRPSTITVAEPAPVAAAEEAAYTLTCYRHPERTTSLRCYNCNRPICISCAKKTPVGYICPDCQRQAEDAFYNSRPLDYLVAALVSLPISLLVGFLLIRFFVGSFFFFLIVFLYQWRGRRLHRPRHQAGHWRAARALSARPGRGHDGPGRGLAGRVAVSVGGLNLFALLGLGIFLFVAGGAAYWQMR